MFLWIIIIVHHFKHAASTIEEDTCQLRMRAGMSQKRRLAPLRRRFAETLVVVEPLPFLKKLFRRFCLQGDKVTPVCNTPCSIHISVPGGFVMIADQRLNKPDEQAAPEHQRLPLP